MASSARRNELLEDGFGLAFKYRPTDTPEDPQLIPNKRMSIRKDSSPDAISHSLIKGENLTALHALLPEYRGTFDLCLIDPPYNTGNTAASGFTYKDSFRNKADRERHSTWLTFMYERLLLTYDLLSTSGVLAINIDDKEVHYLRLLCDEIFGEQNFIAQMVVDGGNPKNNARFISVGHEYMLVYAKNIGSLSKTVGRWRKKREGIDLLLGERERLIRKHNGDHSAVTADLKSWVKSQPFSNRLKVFFNSDEKGLYTYADLSAPGKGARYTVLHPKTGKPCQIPSRGWGLTRQKFDALLADDLVLFGPDEKSQPMRKLYLRNEPDQVERGIIAYPSRSSTHLLEKMLGRRNAFNNPKNLDFIKDVVRLMCPTDGLVLDYFAGSGTTGHAVLALNAEDPNSRRRFVLVTNDENGIYTKVTQPRLKAASTGNWGDGSTGPALGGRIDAFNAKAKKSG